MGNLVTILWHVEHLYVINYNKVQIIDIIMTEYTSQTHSCDSFTSFTRIIIPNLTTPNRILMEAFLTTIGVLNDLDQGGTWLVICFYWICSILTSIILCLTVIKLQKILNFKKKKSFLVGFKISANGLCIYMFKIQLFDLELSFLFLTEIQKKH